MRNGTQSSKLTLIDGAGKAIGEDADALDPSMEYYAASVTEDGDGGQESAPASISPVLILFTVSLACAAAAIAAGSYALWLSRQKAARQTLTDVQDILRICQDRMHQMEDDLNHLPSSLSSMLT